MKVSNIRHTAVAFGPDGAPPGDGLAVTIKGFKVGDFELRLIVYIDTSTAKTMNAVEGTLIINDWTARYKLLDSNIETKIIEAINQGRFSVGIFEHV